MKIGIELKEKNWKEKDQKKIIHVLVQIVYNKFFFILLLNLW